MKLLIFFLLTSCTMNLTNVSSNGRASDQVDSAQDAKADLQADVSGI